MKPRHLFVALAATGVALTGCAQTIAPHGRPGVPAATSPSLPAATDSRPLRPLTPVRPTGQFTFALAGDVNFAERTGARLARNPLTAFGVASQQLRRTDLTMVNLETAIAVGGRPEIKPYTFQAPPTALTALRAAGVDLATMANNHAADYGTPGLQQTLDAIATSHFPVIGIGTNASQAYMPYTTTVNGVPIAVVAASQVRDETLAHFTAGPDTPGIANAYSTELVQAVRAAQAAGYVVIVYVHWGTEYTRCPNAHQRALQQLLVDAGASAVVGTHAHLLQGAGWRSDGRYVAYGLSNYLWWRSYGNEEDDNGVLTLTFTGARVTAAQFAPAHLDETGVPVPATATQADRINAEWERARHCAGLAAQPPN